MKKFSWILALLVLAFSMTFNSCRPPELEGAIVHLNAGRDDQALELAQEATVKYPENPEGWFLLGRIQGKKGMVKDMVTSFDKSLGAGNTFTKEIELEKNSYFGKYYNEAVSSYNAYIKLEDRESEKAKKLLNSVIENFQNSLLIKNDYMAHRLIAVAYQYQGNNEKNLEYLLSAKDAAPDTILAYIELGYYYTAKNNYQKAAEYLEQGLAIDPDNVQCLTMYAQTLDFADRKDEAISAYKNAIAKNPNEKALSFNLGLLLNKQANAIEDDEAKKKTLLEEAIVYFRKAYEVDPDLKETYDILSTLLLQLQRYEEAQEILDEGVKRFPDSASMWQNYSFLHAKLGNTEKANEYYEKSKQLSGENK